MKYSSIRFLHLSFLFFICLQPLDDTPSCIRSGISTSSPPPPWWAVAFSVSERVSHLPTAAFSLSWPAKAGGYRGHGGSDAKGMECLHGSLLPSLHQYLIYLFVYDLSIAADFSHSGFDISSQSALLTTPAYLCYFNQGDIVDGNCAGPRGSVQGGITAAMPAGSWFGALVSGYLSDLFGRKRAIMIGCLFWIIGSAITCASQNIGMLIAGRIINGFCVGIESAQVPVYISEIVPPTKRGRLVGLQQWAITWGILILYYVSYGASFVGGQTPTTYSTAVSFP